MNYTGYHYHIIFKKCCVCGKKLGKISVCDCPNRPTKPFSPFTFKDQQQQQPTAQNVNNNKTVLYRQWQGNSLYFKIYVGPFYNKIFDRLGILSENFGTVFAIVL